MDAFLEPGDERLLLEGTHIFPVQHSFSLDPSSRERKLIPSPPSSSFRPVPSHPVPSRRPQIPPTASTRRSGWVISTSDWMYRGSMPTGSSPERSTLRLFVSISSRRCVLSPLSSSRILFAHSYLSLVLFIDYGRRTRIRGVPRS